MGRYGFWNFVLDACLTMLTSGLWLIWIFVREIRNSQPRKNYIPYSERDG